MDLNMLFEFFNEYSCAITCVSVFLILVFGYLGAPFILWAITVTALALACGLTGTPLYILLGLLVVFAIKPIRRVLISNIVMVMSVRK